MWKRQTVHSEFRNIVEKRLIEDGYKILGRNVKIDDIIIKNTYIIVDILIEKDDKIIPVEIGNIQLPKHYRMTKLKKKFGSAMHIPFRHERRRLLNRKNSLLGCLTF